MLSFTRVVFNFSRNLMKSRFPIVSAYKHRNHIRIANNVILAVFYSKQTFNRDLIKKPQTKRDLFKEMNMKREKYRDPQMKREMYREPPPKTDAHKQPPPTIEVYKEPPAKPDEMAEPPAQQETLKDLPPPPPPKVEEVVLQSERPAVDVAQSAGSTYIATLTQTESTGTQQEDQARQKQEESWQTMKITFMVFGATLTCAVMYMILELGQPKLDDDGEVVVDEFSGLPLVQQYLYRMVRELDSYRKMINEPSREKLLPDVVEYPYHQPPYTLVLEFKDTLVHPDWTYNTGWRFKKRPGIDQLLQALNGVYEIVIYTAELGMTVFPILEALDPNNLITYKLVRDATNFVNGHHVKDLDKLNRDLSKVIVVDWDSKSIQFNRDNVLQIPRWNGEDNDTTLLDLANFLRVIAFSDISDVRDVLRYYKEFDDPIATFKEKQRELERTMYMKNQ